MTPLSAIFVDASEASRKNCQIWHVSRAEGSCSVSIPGDDSAFTGTRAECERFVADRAFEAGRQAWREVARNGGPISGSTMVFLNELAGGE